jgi:heparin binding hemagglutinin HbhA
MAKPTFDTPLYIKAVQTEAQKSAERAFFAGVGATDRAVELLRDYVAAVQKLAQEFAQQRVADVQKAQQKAQHGVTSFEPTSLGITLTKDAKARRTAIEKAVADLQAEALAVPGRAQHALDANVATASAAYADLVKRGEILVDRIRHQQSTKDTVAAAETTVAKAKTTKTQATKAAKKSGTAAKKSATKRSAASRSSAKATTTAAKKTVSAGSRALADAAEKTGD